MVMKRSNFIIATLVALFAVVTVAHMSCTKSSSSASCTPTFCVNGGVCSIDTTTHKPVCTCPTGYEGPSCATVSASKYLGNWNMQQVITGSDSTAYNHDTSYYTVTLTQAYTPTTFFIDNFFNNQEYNHIICTLDSTNSANFGIDTISAYYMVFNHFIVLPYGYGNISNDTIWGLIYIQFKNATTNWQLDTIAFKLWQ